MPVPDGDDRGGSFLIEHRFEPHVRVPKRAPRRSYSRPLTCVKSLGCAGPSRWQDTTHNCARSGRLSLVTDVYVGTRRPFRVGGLSLIHCDACG
jgi:hypothetical protein